MKLLSSIIALSAAGSAAAFAPAPVANRSVVSAKMAAAEELYIDEERRFIMNLIMVGAGAISVAAIGIPYIAFLVPPGSGSVSAAVNAKDAIGIDIMAKVYMAAKPANDRSLAQGLQGDPT